MEEIWHDIRQKCERKEWFAYDADCFLRQGTVLVKVPLEHMHYDKYIVGQHGDIVVGLYHDDDDAIYDVNVAVGGVDICSLHVAPGSLTYLLEGTHCLPIISICYSEVHVYSPKDLRNVYVIYAMIGNAENRIRLASSTIIMHLAYGRDAVVRGSFGFIEDIESYPAKGSYLICPSLA